MNKFKVYTRIKIVYGEPFVGYTGTIVGHYGKECSIVLLDKVPEGKDRGIVIHNDCLIVNE
jgi:hypothetical protein